MRYWKKMLQIGAIVSIVAATWGVWELHPSRHFGYKTYPVLAMPNEADEHSPTSGKLADASASASASPQQNAAEPSLANTASNESPGALSEEIVSPAEKDEKAFNVLLLGVDTDSEEAARTDVIVLVHVMPTLKKLSAVSVPRDTRVNLKGIGETKINHAHALGHAKGGSQGGTDAAIQAVSDMLGVPIHYYAKMNFKGFTEFIDMIGGVDLYFEKDMHITGTDITMKAGEQHLNGSTALTLVRERYSLANGDFGRQAEQLRLMKAVLHELVQPERLVELPGLIGKVKKDVVDTNFSDADLISLAWLFKGVSFDDVNYMQIPGKSAMMEDPLMRMQLWYWIPDKEQVKKIVKQYLSS
ncbi:LCP family protein [Paenibacillus contaminans]|uniref:LytR family transcriptional regulator n=1 Tax=Paenibacillus contaminans TaxID=450362 RepID=A0A329MHE7_9BACL|nr:LCP family protein [Paenibacillus contaminans]RAV19190.1 LytR family transcriptional regulator [Paenibacillus contaminans]